MFRGQSDLSDLFDAREQIAFRFLHDRLHPRHSLGLVLRGATGRSVSDYLSEKIWQPMGAEANATWIVDKGGYETGYCCLNATLRDYARFGMLLAN